jgi:hypothetical protein
MTYVPYTNGGLSYYQIAQSPSRDFHTYVTFNIDGINRTILNNIGYGAYISGKPMIELSQTGINIGDRSLNNSIDYSFEIYLNGKYPVTGKFIPGIPAVNTSTAIQSVWPIVSYSNVLIQAVNPDTGGNITSTLSTNNGALRAS